MVKDESRVLVSRAENRAIRLARSDHPSFFLFFLLSFFIFIFCDPHCSFFLFHFSFDRSPVRPPGLVFDKCFNFQFVFESCFTNLFYLFFMLIFCFNQCKLDRSNLRQWVVSSRIDELTTGRVL